MLEVEYLTDKNGQQKAVVIPIELWRKLLPFENASPEDIAEEIENHCLNKAMDEAQKTPLLSKDEAISFLDE